MESEQEHEIDLTQEETAFEFLEKYLRGRRWSILEAAALKYLIDIDTDANKK